MARTAWAVVTVGILVVLLLLMARAWAARRRRQSSLGEPALPPAQPGPALLEADAYYVATTLAGEPLNRVAVPRLGFRARARVTVTAGGVVLGIPGQADVFLPASALRGVGRATWTVDRVVEPDGLLVIGWLLGDTPVDSYLRATDSAAAAALAETIHTLVPTTTESETSDPR